MSKGFGQQLYLLQYHILHQIKERMMTRIEPQDSLGIFKKCPTLVTSLLSFTSNRLIERLIIRYGTRYVLFFYLTGSTQIKKNQKLNQFFGSRTSVVRYFLAVKSVFRTRVFSGSGSDFFPESGSGSAKNPDPIRKIRIHEKNQ